VRRTICGPPVQGIVSTAAVPWIYHQPLISHLGIVGPSGPRRHQLARPAVGPVRGAQGRLGCPLRHRGLCLHLPVRAALSSHPESPKWNSLIHGSRTGPPSGAPGTLQNTRGSLHQPEDGQSTSLTLAAERAKATPNGLSGALPHGLLACFGALLDLVGRRPLPAAVGTELEADPGNPPPGFYPCFDLRHCRLRVQRTSAAVAPRSITPPRRRSLTVQNLADADGLLQCFPRSVTARPLLRLLTTLRT